MTPPVLRFQIVPNLSTENNTFPNLHYPFIYPYVLNILPFVSRVRTNNDFPLSDQQYILQRLVAIYDYSYEHGTTSLMMEMESPSI